MNIGKRRKSGVEPRPTGSKIRPTQRRPIKAATRACLGECSRTCTPQISASGRRCCRAPSHVAERKGADLARARPDGYTIDLSAIGPHVLNGALYSLPYNVLNDFAPIAPLTTAPYVLVARRTMPAKDLNELIVWLKANPSKASVGVTAVGPRLAMVLFQKETRTQLTLVPYRGNASARQDLAASQIDLMVDVTDGLPLVRAGSMRAYAITSATRLASAPDIPTFGELGLPAVSWLAWYGLFAPRGTPSDVIGRLNEAAVEALSDPAVRSGLGSLGMEIFPRERQTPEALGALVKADAEKWWPIMKEFGIKGQ